jgi:hypothetical protein
VLHHSLNAIHTHLGRLLCSYKCSSFSGRTIFLHSLLQDPITEKLQKDPEIDSKKLCRGDSKFRKDVRRAIEANQECADSERPAASSSTCAGE